MGLNNLPEDTNLSNILAAMQDRIDRLERATRILPGSIGNNSLLSPIVPQSVHDSTTGFGLTPAWATLKSTVITVPALMVSAIVMMTTRTFAYNPNTTGGADSAGADYLYAKVTIAGTSSIPFPLVIRGLMSSDINVSTLATVLTGLTPGGAFTIDMTAASYFITWAAQSGNTAELSGIILWYR